MNGVYLVFSAYSCRYYSCVSGLDEGACVIVY